MALGRLSMGPMATSQVMTMELIRSDSRGRYSRVSQRDELLQDRQTSEKKHDDSKLRAIMESLKAADDTPKIVPGTFREAVQFLLESMAFQGGMAGCIILNALVIGGETDFPDLEFWAYVENAFLIIFTAELSMRLYAIGPRKFFASGEDQLWNIFDFAIVAMGLFDAVSEIFQPKDEDSKGGGGISTIFRMIRLLRILRIFKIVRFLKQLYLLAFGLIEAARAVFWVTVLMVFALYICSIILVRTYGQTEDGSDAANDLMHDQFRSIGGSMLSLFELMVNPGDVKDYKTIMPDLPFFALFLICYVIFGSFGMIALLTGVISESMFEKNQLRAAEERREREQTREVMQEKCKEMFNSMELNEEKEASIEELKALLPFVCEMFDGFGIEYMQHEVDNVLAISDTNHSGYISETEFVSGIMSLCDRLSAASIQEVFYLVSQMCVRLKSMEERGGGSIETQGYMEQLNTDLQEISKGTASQLESLQNEVRHMTYGTIPRLQADIKQVLHKLQLGFNVSMKTPAAAPSAPSYTFSDVNLTSMTDSTGAHLVDTGGTPLANHKDSCIEIISKQVDELKANVNELLKRPVPFNGDIFTLADAQNEHLTTANAHRPSQRGSDGKARQPPVGSVTGLQSYAANHDTSRHEQAQMDTAQSSHSITSQQKPAGPSFSSAQTDHREGLQSYSLTFADDLC